MAVYEDECQQCGKKFRNNDVEPLRFCCIGCQVDWAHERPREETLRLRAGKKEET